MARFELYHDESKEADTWHGILLAPEGEKARPVAVLCAARDRMGYPHPLSLKNVRENKKDVCRIAASWISSGVAAPASCCRPGSDPVVYGMARQKGGNAMGVLERPIGAKFILLRERDSLRTMSEVLDHGTRVETTFRMATRGGLYYSGGEEEPIRIQDALGRARALSPSHEPREDRETAGGAARLLQHLRKRGPHRRSRERPSRGVRMPGL